MTEIQQIMQRMRESVKQLERGDLPQAEKMRPVLVSRISSDLDSLEQALKKGDGKIIIDIPSAGNIDPLQGLVM